MKQTAVRLLNLAPRGRHAADPLTVPPTRPVRPPAIRQAVAANLTERRALTAQADQPTVAIPALNVDVSWPPAPDRWHPPVTAEECAGRMARIAYPPPAAGPERLAAVMCQVSAATGTSTRYEDPRAWKRPALEASGTTGSWYGSWRLDNALAETATCLQRADEARILGEERTRAGSERRAA